MPKVVRFTNPSSIMTYAVRGLVDLARHEATGPVTVKLIAKRQGIPAQCLEQVFNRLKRHGLIVAERGPRGGYRLNAPPSKIPISRIFQSLDERKDKNGRPTSFSANDPAHSVWRQVEKAVKSTLDATTLETLVQQAERQSPTPFAHSYTFHI